jgi:hypothetical protein
MLAERENRLEVILAQVEEGVGMFRNGIEAADDATMVVLRVGEGYPLRALKTASASVSK